MKKLFLLFGLLFPFLFDIFALNWNHGAAYYTLSSKNWISFISVRKNQKKSKISPKEERELEGIHEKLDFLDNILDQIEQDLNQIEKQQDLRNNEEQNPNEKPEEKNSNP